MNLYAEISLHQLAKWLPLLLFSLGIPVLGKYKGLTSLRETLAVLAFKMASKQDLNTFSRSKQPL